MSSGPLSPVPGGPNEVRAYLKRLLIAIAIGVVTMSSAAWYAWSRWGPKPEDARPMPKRAPAGAPVLR